MSFKDTRVSILISQRNTVKGPAALSSAPIVTHACEHSLDETGGKRVKDGKKEMGGIFMQFETSSMLLQLLMLLII